MNKNYCCMGVNLRLFMAVLTSPKAQQVVFLSLVVSISVVNYSSRRVGLFVFLKWKRACECSQFLRL